MGNTTKILTDKYENAYNQINNWFIKQGWNPFPFQEEVWNEYLNGNSGLIHASTGMGKTYAVWLGALIQKLSGELNETGLKILWITPLRALASDTCESLIKPMQNLGINWRVEKRTGDTSASIKNKQKKQLPDTLVITPESLSILLSYPKNREQLSGIKLIVVDEWHELLGSKRGVLTELCLARLKKYNPDVSVWGLSATLGNTNTAMQVLLGNQSYKGKLIRGLIPKEIKINSIIPEQIERFPWAGHLGMKMLPDVIKKVDESKSVLVFTNTRSQTENWYQAILESRPDWAGIIALHHGSLDTSQRSVVEELLKNGKIKCVVCTSSLDLGVDFSPVDRVIQIGSPKGIARLLQRAGRSGHQPGRLSEVICVPTHAFELIEISAVRDSILNGKIEAREPIIEPLDVLIQHAITIAAGEGFTSGELFDEVKSTHAFKDLSQQIWDWILDFISKGGPALRAYPEYRRVTNKNGFYSVEDNSIAKFHRMSIGTIVTDSEIKVRYLKGSRLGNIEESFIAKLKPGDTFIFAGRTLEFVRVKDMTAWVRKAKSNTGLVPKWMGGRMPLSTELASSVRNKYDELKHGKYNSEEMKALIPLINLQKKWSVIPGKDEFLIEKLKSREGYHLFFYPFEGRAVNEGLSALFAYRISRIKPITFTIAINDYGFELLSSDSIPIEEALNQNLLSTKNLTDDILSSLNSVEIVKRRFREIARIAGLIFQGYPGSNKSVKQIQVSSSLFFEVFRKFDPENLLLFQARKEVLEKQLEYARLESTLKRLNESKLILKEIEHPTPTAFPIMVDSWRERLSSEKLADRVKRMQLQLENEADKEIKHKIKIRKVRASKSA